MLFVVILSTQDADDLLEQDINLPKTTVTQEIIEELVKNPIDINQATFEDLIKIPFLTPVLAHKIIETRNQKDKFKSIAEIKPVIGKEIFDEIRQFIIICVEPAKIQIQFRARFLIDTLGNISQTRQWSSSNRIAFSSFNKDNQIKIVLNTDKDINETNFADFLSASASITTKNNKLILGNYVLSFGSQLLFSGPYSYINSIKNFSVSPMKSISELTGAYENSSLFGIGFFQTVSNWQIYSFLSSTQLDADIKNGCVKRIYYYTRYVDSITQARRNQLREDLLGFRISKSLMSNQDHALNVGLSAYHNQYDKPFAPIDSSNSFYGSNLNLMSIDFQSRFNNYFARTEFGYCLNRGFGNATQIIGDWQFLKVNLSIYAQEKDFFSPHSKWRTLTNRKDRIMASFNIYYNLSGFKMYLLTSTSQNFTVESLPARVQYKLERKQNKFNFGLTLKGSYKESVLNNYGTRLDVSYHANKYWEILARFEDKYLKGAADYGYLFCLSSKYYIQWFSIEPRFYYFSVSSSQNRIYAYENYSGSIGFYSNGYRVSLSAQVKIKQWLKFDYLVGLTRADKSNINSSAQVVIDL